MQKKCLKAISLFTGAGGLDIGFERAGFEISVAIEADPSCCDTLIANRPKLHLINQRIQDVPSSEILDAAGIDVLDAALVIGGPPCQSFSLAGKRKGLEDERGKLLFEFVRVVRETLPAAFVLENVKGLLNWDKGEALRMLVEALAEPIVYQDVTYQYSVAKPQVLDAAYYGVPQHRERLFIIGNRLGLEFHYPDKTSPTPPTVGETILSLPTADKPSQTAQRVAGTIAKRRAKHGY